MANGPMKGPAARINGKKVDNAGKLFVRLMKYIMKNYLAHIIIVVICILGSVLANVQGTWFTQSLIDNYITPMIKSGAADFAPLIKAILRVACFYLLGALCTYIYTRIMVYVTQGTLKNLRTDMFVHMQSLPIKYFDTHAHGDIMSTYTNDIDTLRQMISQSMPQFLSSLITIVSVFLSMIFLNIPLTILTLVMVAIMLFATKAAASRSGKFFAAQQKDLGKVNGYIEEMMNGQKVVKVFCHENEAIEDFNKLMMLYLKALIMPTNLPMYSALLMHSLEM